MMVVVGESGTAKTTECVNLAKANNHIFLTISANETPHSLMTKLCLESGIAPWYRTTQMEQALIEHLGSARQAIFVDECDLLFRSRRKLGMIESLRIIHDLAVVPIVLIGPPELEFFLARYSHLNRRVVERVRFSGLTLGDAKGLVSDLCEVGIEYGVIRQIHAKYPRIGDFLNHLQSIEDAAKTQCWEAINASQYDALSPMLV